MDLVNKRFRLFFSLVLLFFSGTAFSANINWTGSVNSDWNTAGNWSGGAVPANGDVVNIGIVAGSLSAASPVVNSTPSGTPSLINVGSLLTSTITVSSGATLNAGALTMSATTLSNQFIVNGTLKIAGDITLNNGLLGTNQITLGANSTLYLSGNINGGTLVPSSSATSKIVLNGTANTQSFGTGTTTVNGNIGVLEISNTYNASTTSRGVTFTGGTVNHVIVDANAIFNANGSLVEGTNYYATIGANALYISRSTFNLHANDSIDVTSTLQFTATNQVINLFKQNSTATNVCPNVIFTGTTITINGGPATYSAGNVNNNSVFWVRGFLDITSTTSAITYNGVSLIDIDGNFTGSTALACGSLPINIGGSWMNSGNDVLMGKVTYDGDNSSKTQIAGTSVTYGNTLAFTGVSPKKVASGTLKIGGNLDNSAGSSVDFVSNATTTLMNGTAAQTILGGTNTNSTYSSDVVNGTILYNLTIATGGSTAAGKTTTLSGYTNIAPSGIINLTVSGGKLDASASNSLTLMSTAGGSAAVGDLTNGGTITGASMPGIAGNVYVQRFLTGNNSMYGSTYVYRGYRLLSSPVNVTSATASTSAATPNYISLNYLKGQASGNFTYGGAFVAGSGGTAGGFSAYNANPTVYFFIETLGSSNTCFVSGKNIGINSITGTQVSLSDGGTYNIPVGNGYIMYFVGPGTRSSGSASIAPADAMMTAPGYVNQGTISVNLWFAPAGGSAGQLSYNYPTLAASRAGFNMVGNPYPCSLNLSTVMADNTGIDAVYLLNDKNPGQAYTVYTPNGTSAPSSGYVVSGEGFMVHATGAGATLTFKETQKAPATQLTGSALVLAANRSASQALSGLYMKMEQDSVVNDYCGIYFRSDWSDKFEAGDAMDMDGASPSVYMSSYTSDGMRTAVNHMPDFQQKTARVKLYTDAKTSGLYKLKLEGVRNIDTLYNIWLIDHYKKDSLDIRSYGTYAFNILKTDTGSYGANRFELVIRRKTMAAYQLRSFAAQKAVTGVRLNWNTNNEGNYTGFALEKLNPETKQYQLIYSRQSNGEGAYNYTDLNLLTTGPNTYRLKQSDIDGNISYSNIATVIYGSPNNGIQLYPNPARENLQISVITDDATKTGQTYVTTIYNSSGIVVARKTSSSNSWSAEVSSLSPGAYTAEIKDNKGDVTGKAKFIKVQ